MLGKIVSIINNIVYIEMSFDIYKIESLINKNVIFDANTDKKQVGEIVKINRNIIEISLIGEIINNNFIYGDLEKPAFNSNCRLITNPELDIIYSINNSLNNITLGKSFVYNNYQIKLDVNNFFANHFAILGNTGSGKSYSVSKIIQSLFSQNNTIPYKSNIFLFDAYGEYQQALSNIGNGNEYVNYKIITTNLMQNENEHLQIPFWLLGVDDIAILLNATEKTQIPIIEKALKLVGFFVENNETVIKQKNSIIANAILDVIFSGRNPSEIKNKIVSILSKFHTTDINLEIELVKGGWTRTLRQCIYVESDGKMADIELVIGYLESLTDDNFELVFPDGSYQYTIYDFELALEFALISEGAFSNDKVYNSANALKIRLNSLINSDYVNYFKFPNFVSKDEYIRYLLTNSMGKKVQVINFNINYVDDRFAKGLVKIYSKLLFDYIVRIKDRATFPFHIILEEAHRYVQNDTDVDILGYNIFERITKEGRKYGIMLGLISQRPSELSETALSQCSNFLVFKMFHPKDLKFISDIIPGINENVVSTIKTFHPGTCLILGTAFKMPVLVSLDKPNPEPLSSSCNINETWYIKK